MEYRTQPKSSFARESVDEHGATPKSIGAVDCPVVNAQCDCQNLSNLRQPKEPTWPADPGLSMSTSPRSASDSEAKEDLNQGVQIDFQVIRRLLETRLDVIERKLDETLWAFASTAQSPHALDVIVASKTPSVEKVSERSIAETSTPEADGTMEAQYLSPCGSERSVKWDDNDCARLRRPSIASVQSTSSVRSISTDRALAFFADKGKQLIHWKNKSSTIWTFLDDPSSSTGAACYSRAMLMFTLVAVFFPLMQGVEPPLLSRRTAGVLDTCFDIVFVVEIAVRWILCPSRCGFFRDVYNLLDLAVLAPLTLRTCALLSLTGQESKHVDLVLLCIVPVLRLLKTMRAFPNQRLLYHALKDSAEALSLPLFMLLVLTLNFSTLLYLVEPRDNVLTIPHAAYLVAVTVSTVGYGDITPATDTGRMICATLSIIGVLYMAMPLTIVGEAFNKTWQNRDRILLGDRVHQVLVQKGYSDEDLFVLLNEIHREFDLDGSNTLDLVEFTQFVQEMHLGFNDHRTIDLFKAFDHNRSGTIDAQEFLHAMFPLVKRKTSRASIKAIPRSSIAGQDVHGGSPCQGDGGIGHM